MSSETSGRTHVLLTLGMLFTLGGATRFLPAAEAEAETATKAAPESAKIALPSAQTPPATAKPARPGPERNVCFSESAAQKMAEDRWLFESEQETLTQEKIAVKTLQADLEERAAALLLKEKAVDARWSKMQLEANADIAHLAQMYGAMKPDQAAAIFDQMDASFAAGFLRRLSSDQAGLILASMESKQAYVVSVKLAAANDDIRIAGPSATGG